MSKLNLSLFLQAYDDQRSTNAPSRSPINWNRDLIGLTCSNPKSEDYTIDPGTTQLIFSSLRTLNSDGTTEYSIALKPLTSNTYVLSWASGTQPNFRTPRSIGGDATTQFVTSINGPLVTFTSISGIAASFVGLVAGMTTGVTITANSLGTAGNSVVLNANGTSSINSLISAWNTSNPSNTVTLTSGDGTQIPVGSTHASYTGTPTGTTLPITITANNVGTVGNSVTLTGDGTSTEAVLISNWNTANPSNQIALTSGVADQIPSSGALIQLSGGENPNSIDLSGGVAATQMNFSSVVVGDNVTIGSNFNPLNQGTFQIQAVTTNSFSVQNLVGVAEGPILLGSGFATQVQIYGAVGVQVGDTLVIDAGFSPVTWGSYNITAVYAESLEFYSTAVLPQQSSVMTTIDIYSSAKSLIYMESNSPISVSINGGIETVTIQPFALPGCCSNSNGSGNNNTVGNNNQPGMLMLKSTVYSLSVTNNGINPASVFLAAVE